MNPSLLEHYNSIKYFTPFRNQKSASLSSLKPDFSGCFSSHHNKVGDSNEKTCNHDNKNYSINREYLKSEFEWLYDHIDKLDHFSKYGIIVKDDIYKSIVKDKYENLLIYMKQLPQINLQIMEYKNIMDYGHEYATENTVYTENNRVIIETFLQDMEISFKNYIYDYTVDSELDWHNYYRVILFVLHLITTHLDEIEFDLFVSPIISMKHD